MSEPDRAFWPLRPPRSARARRWASTSTPTPSPTRARTSTLNPRVGQRAIRDGGRARRRRLPAADIVLANLTGAVLVQNAALLQLDGCARWTLIVSGLQTHERKEVVRGLRGAHRWRWSGRKQAGRRSRSTFPRPAQSKDLGSDASHTPFERRPVFSCSCVLAGTVFLGAQASRPGQQPARDTPAQQTADAATPKARITGRVIAVDTGRPIRRARVFLSGTDVPGGRGSLTDDEGRFELTELPEGPLQPHGREDRLHHAVLRAAASAPGGHSHTTRGRPAADRNRLRSSSRQRHRRTRL